MEQIEQMDTPSSQLSDLRLNQQTQRNLRENIRETRFIRFAAVQRRRYTIWRHSAIPTSTCYIRVIPWENRDPVNIKRESNKSSEGGSRQQTRAWPFRVFTTFTTLSILIHRPRIEWIAL